MSKFLIKFKKEKSGQTILNNLVIGKMLDVGKVII